MMQTLPVNGKSPDPFNAANVESNRRRHDVLKAYVIARAREKHLNFVDYMWQNPSEPLIIGRHTRAICSQIDDAVDRYKKGRSVFKIITVPFRHGKAFHVDTPVLTVTGWKAHGELKAGDWVFDAYGEVKEVIAATPIYLHARYAVSFEHGETLFTTPEHEWPVTVVKRYGDCGCGPAGILETKRLRFNARGRNRRHELIIERSADCDALALHNGGICCKGPAKITEVKPIAGTHRVNCIQVDGGYYLVGRGMIPTHNSEIISRKLPAHFLGLFPDAKILMTGYTSSLAVGYSKESRNLLLSEKYMELFPETRLNPFDSAAAHWKIDRRQGEVFACGLGGSMTGRGYTLGIVDDYCRNRQDAESPTVRERMWNSFANDFLTRRAPKSITIVTATPWHVDDIIGRVKSRMKEDRYFPRFEFLAMPAFDDEYPEGILFPERFTRQWYDEQRATLGEYGTASLLQCDPVAKGGNILKVENVKRASLKDYPSIPYMWVWDLAHTAAERSKGDPDYTSGTLLGFRRKPGAPRQWELWIKDVKRFRADAPKRDAQIVAATEADGNYVKVGIENTIDSRDAFNHLSYLLFGRRVVVGIKGKGDKVVRASALEPIFEAGEVYVPDGATWLNAWLDELTSFPNGRHDDMVDNLSAGFVHYNKTSGATSVPLYGV